ncbi:262_t:CDS:2, partial [Ambispora gerdemannii]
ILSDPSIQKLEKAILALNNEINRMQTETEWKVKFSLKNKNLQKVTNLNTPMKLRLSESNLLPYLMREGRGMDILPRKYITSYLKR